MLVARSREHVELFLTAFASSESLLLIYYIGQRKSNVISEPCLWNRELTFMNSLKNNTVAVTLVPSV